MKVFFWAVFFVIFALTKESFSFNEIDSAMDNVLLEPVPKKITKARETRKALVILTDKVHGLSTVASLEIAKDMAFGDLKLKLMRCFVGANETEEYAFISIFDEAQKRDVFSGWMMKEAASSNSLEHQRYDVTLTKCT